MFMRVANAIRVISDERGNLPDISDTEPQKLSFLVAAAMEIEVETKQELLELRSTSERLARLRDQLARVVKGYEERARLHTIGKGNGHGGQKIQIEQRNETRPVGGRDGVRTCRGHPNPPPK